MFVALQAGRSQTKMANSHRTLIDVTAAQWNKTYRNVYGNKRETLCPVVRVSGSQEDLVFTVLPDPELETWDWSTLTSSYQAFAAWGSSWFQPWPLPWLTLPQQFWLLWTTQPTLVADGVGKGWERRKGRGSVWKLPQASCLVSRQLGRWLQGCHLLSRCQGLRASSGLPLWISAVCWPAVLCPDWTEKRYCD